MDRGKLQAISEKSKIKITIEYGEFGEDEFDMETTFPAQYMFCVLGGTPNPKNVLIKTLNANGEPMKTEDAFRVWLLTAGAAFSQHPKIHKEYRKALNMFFDHLEGITDILNGPEAYYPSQVNLTGRSFSDN